jgi:phenylalanyl-tRNA synthetase beta chain
LPKFAEIDRDLAFVVSGEITCEQIENEIKSACKYVSAVRLFDVYTGAQVGEGKKSMAFNVTFTPKDEPISNENVDNFVKKILKSLEYKLGITLR